MKYKRKNVVVDAFQAGFDDEPAWFQMAVTCGIVWIEESYGAYMIGDIEIPAGSYVVKGVDNEIWWVEEDTFDLYYELVGYD